MLASSRKFQAVLLSLCLSGALAENSTTVEPSVVSGRAGNHLDLFTSATGKGFDPPPEFYRSPGTDRGGGLMSGGPGGQTALGSVGETLSETYNKWRGVQALGLQQRISVGHNHASSGDVTQHTPSVGSFESSSHPYPYEFSPGGGTPAAALGASYGGGSGAYFGSSSIEAGIPFDVYGTRPSHGLGHGHFSPAEYAYPYGGDHHELAAHKGPAHGELSSKALLAKSFLIPLASAAVLGIAAALVSNPLLLQLGTVSGLGTAIVGKRKKRDADERPAPPFIDW
ncbi:hypothetical protein KR018_003233 [Drosophila ironensis]|nr:hypothetical protein KR018_003233 [Drosophila ironensis]